MNQVVYPCRRKAGCGVSNRTAKLITSLKISSFSSVSFQTCSSKNAKLMIVVVVRLLLLDVFFLTNVISRRVRVFGQPSYAEKYKTFLNFVIAATQLYLGEKKHE